MDYFEYGDLSRLYRLFESIASFITLIIIVSIAVAIAVYLYNGYVLMCMGRKAGLRKENDWMAYVPVARDLYALRMAGKSWWCVFSFRYRLCLCWHIVASACPDTTWDCRSHYLSLIRAIRSCRYFICVGQYLRRVRL